MFTLVQHTWKSVCSLQLTSVILPPPPPIYRQVPTFKTSGLPTTEQSADLEPSGTGNLTRHGYADGLGWLCASQK